ncbi:hypothetical protein L210DRAFT_3560636 [Boletus edulis BED1]|uniref:Uncharacterized protein n=1 Tax=Boletus edulis BED1 TaxID=1328754 RepID=A0AAD4G902_BOLED|nr:hypothetical protein L210DRAFT_3560636 [Boletus edulis BED1]
MTSSVTTFMRPILERSSLPSDILSASSRRSQTLRREARDAYAASLKTVFIVAAYSTLTVYLIWLPIPDKVMDEQGFSESGPQTDAEVGSDDGHD